MPSMTWVVNGTWPVPSNADPASIRVQAGGESGTGGVSAHGSHAGGGSGAGAYGEEPALGGLVPGSTTLAITVPQGGTGNPTTVTGGSVTVQANAGQSASGQTGGNGGTAGSNTVAFAGGAGATGSAGSAANGGGGGGPAGPSGAGGTASGSTGGSAGAGTWGVAGASGAGTSSNGASGTAPGAGASGGGSGGATNHTGGSGAAGQVVITWSVVTYSASGYAAATGVMAGIKRASGGFKGYLSFTGAPLPIAPVNQWSGTFAQPSAFGTMPPALQSIPVALTPANSVGGGSGFASPGNWLFCVTGISEASASAGFTVSAADDIHSFWRPGDVTASNWAVSTAAGLTRASAWYTPNTLRQVNTVYVSPDGCMDAISVLVIEVAGLGPWDTVTGIYSSYAAAAMSLGLSLGAPSGQAFILGAVCGDNDSAGQAFAPSGWTALSTVTATNGTDHTCDCVLTSACITTSGAVSVTGTASSAADLSGVVIGVLTSGPSPIAPGANPAWPQRAILEFAPEGGYGTPPDELTWVTLSDNQWPGPWGSSGQFKRFWGWTDKSVIPWGLGQYQSSSGTIALDNADGALSPSNSASPWYPNVTAGTPVRLRMALGTITTPEGSVTYDRWYIWQRNAQSFPEKRNKALRGWVEATTTDPWQSATGSCPTPYRAEVEQDSPGWWWPMDDQSLAGGVLPASLRNAAAGSSTVLQILASPNGVSSQDLYSSSYGGAGGAAGTDLTAVSTSANPAVAVYNVAQLAGWMYGDPQVSPQSSQTGNPTTAQPGSAAWQQTGAQGNTGAHGWFLAATDTFPPIASGVTIAGWWDYAFAGTAASIDNSGTFYNVAGQPWCQLSLLELATSSAPVAILYLDTSGHLILETYSGGTGTTHAIYSGSDLRCSTFLRVTVQLTQTSYTVWVNGTLTASASGSCTISASAWNWLVANGDLGSGGGSTLSGIQHGGNVAVSHLTVFAGLLPKYRELAQYSAAITGCGLLPAPTSVQASSVVNQNPTGFTADGSEYQGSYGSGGGTFTLSGVAVAVAGAYTSGPSARSVLGGQGFATPASFGAALYTAWSALAPLVNVYTAASAAAETGASACLGSGESYTSGYGSGASGHGASHVSGGTGASPPAGPSALGDTVQTRLERILGYGGITGPRAIDPAALQVQAALDVGGQQTGASIAAIQGSDSGWWFYDLCSTANYRQRSHLNADTPVWYIGMDVAAGMVPFAGDIEYDNDPQRTFTVITIQPYSPDGASLAEVVPADYTAVSAAQKQYGPKPLPVSSYLQSTAEMQAHADWAFSYYGTVRKRVKNMVIDAATHPAAWGLVLALSLGDLIQVYDAPQGAPASTTVYRVSSASRTVSGGTGGGKFTGSITLVADPVLAFWV